MKINELLFVGGPLNKEKRCMNVLDRYYRHAYPKERESYIDFTEEVISYESSYLIHEYRLERISQYNKIFHIYVSNKVDTKDLDLNEILQLAVEEDE